MGLFYIIGADKYKPQTIKDLIGQQGDKSCVQKLIIWLRDWYKHHGHSDEKVKAKPSFGFNRNENPAMFKAALLSGPPGIGKTTAAQLVCQHLNFEYIEKNASDQRSKKSMLNLSNDTYSIAHFSSSSMSKYVLIMDEVDGVTGNEDRGGVQELISLIKRSRIPIICICNDRQHKKIRSLASYCYDLRFHRPNIQQIRNAMLTILHREKIENIKQEILDEIIQSCNQDIRQTIHSLNLWTIQGVHTTSSAAKMIEKTINSNPFELCRLSFSDELRHKSLVEKSDIFFSDYQLIPLLIQENYLQCQPHVSSNQKRKLTDTEHLNLISKAADNICLGDICSQMIFSKNESWSLLPYQVIKKEFSIYKKRLILFFLKAIFSTVAPCSYVRGHLRGMVNFSSFFGQRSRRNKNERLLNEIEKHLCLKTTSANKQQFNLDYLPYLSRILISPLKQLSQEKGIEQCISLLDDYYLNREDFQTMMELNTWGKTSRNLYEQLDTQIKSSLTRNYNKTNHRTPYTIIDIKKLKRAKNVSDDEEGEEEVEEKEENENIEEDAMIKLAKKPTVIKKPRKK
jgi:replication factor C subunit 1